MHPSVEVGPLEGLRYKSESNYEKVDLCSMNLFSVNVLGLRQSFSMNPTETFPSFQHHKCSICTRIYTECVPWCLQIENAL